MARQSLSLLLRYIRQLAKAPGDSPTTDYELVQRFLNQRDQPAFEALVRRHGAMVFQVAQRLLHQEQDAEDVFQATFLTLARKAGSLRKPGSVACWLHGVAHRLALQTRDARVNRSAHESRVAVRAAPDNSEEISLREARGLLDEELRRLSARYRAPLVLCYLEGATRDEAARQLHVSLSTLKRRLERGRDLLRIRLNHRGLTVATALSAVLLAESTTQTAVPAPLLSSLVQAALLVAANKPLLTGLVSAQAVTLTERMVRIMWITKLQTAALCCALAVAVTGTGVLAHQEWARKGSDSTSGPSQVAVAQEGENRKPAREELPSSEPPKGSDGQHFQAIVRGAPVELLGVVQNSPLPRGTQWWKADGSPLPSAPYKETWTWSNERNAFEFAFRVPGNAGYSYTAVGPQGTSTAEPTVPWNEPGQFLPDVRSVVVGKVAREMKEITLRFGLATQPWQVVETWADYPWAQAAASVFVNSFSVILTWPRQENNGVVVEATHPYVEDATRLVAYDRQGKRYAGEESPGGRGKNLIRRVYRFAVKLTDVQRFEFQRRRYDTWITFKNVSLQPGHHTPVQVEVEHPPSPGP